MFSCILSSTPFQCGSRTGSVFVHAQALHGDLDEFRWSAPPRPRQWEGKSSGCSSETLLITLFKAPLKVERVDVSLEVCEVHLWWSEGCSWLYSTFTVPVSAGVLSFVSTVVWNRNILLKQAMIFCFFDPHSSGSDSMTEQLTFI